MRSNATFSEDRRFRYTLTRQWDESLPSVAFICLNPSTADQENDDPTIRRCIGFAKSWGKGGLLILNLYAYRATIPADMWRAQKRGIDIIGGSRNWVSALQDYFADAGCDLAIAAWGTGKQRGRGTEVARHWPGLMCLAHCADKMPKHPLYLKADLKPIDL